MIHRCNVQCHTVDPTKLENMGMEDEGKWLPFIIDMDNIKAAKLTSDDPSTNVYNCTTVFCKEGDTFIIDTPYKDFFSLLEKYILSISFPFGDIDDGLPGNENDLEL